MFTERAIKSSDEVQWKHKAALHHLADDGERSHSEGFKYHWSPKYRNPHVHKLFGLFSVHWVDTWWANGAVYSSNKSVVVGRLRLKILDYILPKAFSHVRLIIILKDINTPCICTTLFNTYCRSFILQKYPSHNSNLMPSQVLYGTIFHHTRAGLGRDTVGCLTVCIAPVPDSF